MPIKIIDFLSEWVGNGLELMAKGMRTQPTSRNFIPTSQNLDVVHVFSCFRFFVYFELKTVFFQFYLNNL